MRAVLVPEPVVIAQPLGIDVGGMSLAYSRSAKRFSASARASGLAAVAKNALRASVMSAPNCAFDYVAPRRSLQPKKTLAQAVVAVFSVTLRPKQSSEMRPGRGSVDDEHRQQGGVPPLERLHKRARPQQPRSAQQLKLQTIPRLGDIDLRLGHKGEAQQQLRLNVSTALRLRSSIVHAAHREPEMAGVP